MESSSTIEKEDWNHDEEEAQKYSKLFVFSGGHKAGMQDMDKDKQARIIYEMSKNSAFFKRAAKMDEVVEQKAAGLLHKFQSVDEVLNPALFHRLTGLAHKRLLELEKRRSFTQMCCVLDMDMFYAAVEIRDAPHLKDLPVAVGGSAMISTSNYVARKFGVRAAMPGFIARKLCPQLVFVKCNFDKYRLVAEQIRGVIAKHDPAFHSTSLDEVYFDLTEAARLRFAARQLVNGQQHHHHQQQRQQQQRFENQPPPPLNYHDDKEEEEEVEDTTTGVPSIVASRSSKSRHQMPTCCAASDGSPSPESLRPLAFEILHEIRAEISRVTGGLTASAGLANNFFLAKICADINKPNGQYELPVYREAVLQFLKTLSTRKVGGIGKVTEKLLDRLGMHTMGDVRDQASRILHTFTPVSSEFLLRVAMGIGHDEGLNKSQRPGCGFAFSTDHAGDDSSSISANATVVRRKSIGCERTYSAKGVSDLEEVFEKLHDICQHLQRDMKKENLIGKTVTVKVKDTHFNVHTRCQSSSTFNVSSAESIEQLARPILASLWPLRVRLLGVSVSKFKNGLVDPNWCNANGSSTAVAASGKKVLDYFKAAPSYNHNDNNTIRGSSSSSRNALNRIDTDSSGGANHCPPTIMIDSDESNQDNNDNDDKIGDNDDDNDNDEGVDDMLLEHEFSQEEKQAQHEPTTREKTPLSARLVGTGDLVQVDLTEMVDSDVSDVSEAPAPRASHRPSLAVCPICSCTLSGGLIPINDHIDNCLAANKKRHFLPTTPPPAAKRSRKHAGHGSSSTDISLFFVK
jgi:DNA polymerase kappa